jgi:hypothetical protein
MIHFPNPEAEAMLWMSHVNVSTLVMRLFRLMQPKVVEVLSDIVSKIHLSFEGLKTKGSKRGFFGVIAKALMEPPSAPVYTASTTVRIGAIHAMMVANWHKRTDSGLQCQILLFSFPCFVPVSFSIPFPSYSVISAIFHFILNSIHMIMNGTWVVTTTTK